MLFFLASLAILFSRKFSLASTHCICASPTDWPSLFFSLLIRDWNNIHMCCPHSHLLPPLPLPSILSNLKAGAILIHLLSFQCLTSARSGCWRTKLIALSHSFAHFITQMSCLSRNLCGSSKALCFHNGLPRMWALDSSLCSPPCSSLYFESLGLLPYYKLFLICLFVLFLSKGYM